MATYEELFDLKNNGDLLQKVEVAITKKAQGLIDGGAPTADEIAWSANAIANPRKVGEKIYRYVLAANSDSSVAQITGASDATIQSNVDTAVDALIAGGVTS